ncbi:MAG: protein kinase, partial [Candidatus Latescibacteria bacterium]|nr:protein kinase [Candidatus Latescibacterota bacterium]
MQEEPIAPEHGPPRVPGPWCTLPIMSDPADETRRLETGAVPAHRFPAGRVLGGRYRLEEELGRGGMGVVLRAEDTELRRSVAVKVLTAGEGDEESRSRFLREARAAAALNHPGLVTVHDVGEDEGDPFLVMELVEGVDLSSAPASELAETLAIALQVCEALEHVHGRGIVHRDLKPANVMRVGSADSTKVKLADLGLALARGAMRVTGSHAIVGTVAYMAPEQALGREVDVRADLYALGAMLYEMTTGRPPFTGDDPLGVVSQHVHAPVVPPRALRPSIPMAMERVILRLLAKDPEQRYANAGEVRAALEATRDGGDEPSEAAPAAVAVLEALSRGRMVGRAQELNEGREIWRRALGGRSHCLLISGEPGAGKTRLSRELLLQAELDGAVVMAGGCYEYEATTPYLPFVEAFRRWVHARDDETLRAALGDRGPMLAKLAPELTGRLGPFPERTELPPAEERILLFESVARTLAALAERGGLLLFLDDLHWADGGTLWLLSYLLRNLRDQRLLVVGAYRETELDRAHPLARALVDWNRERLTTRLVLRRFEFEETQAQLEALLGESVSTEFTEIVHAETEGNPFFVEEVLKALIEDGSVRRESGRWERSDIPDIVLPQGMKSAIGSRLDRVSPECNEVLRAAA